MSIFQRFSFKQFKVLDIFGSEISLNYKNENLFKTPFGGFVTITLIVVLILLFLNNIILLFSKSKVKTVFYTKYNTAPETLTLDRSNFMIATKYDQNNFIDSPMVNITFEKRHYIRYINGTYIQEKLPVQLEPCTIEHFSSLPSYQVNWTETFIQQNFTDFLCLKKDEVFEVAGRWENDDFKFLKFQVNACKNKTIPYGPWNPQCQSREDVIKNTSEDSRIKFFFVNYLLSPEKTDNVIQAFPDTVTLTIQPEKMFSTANVMINQQTLTTDESIIPLKDISSQSFPAIKQGDYITSFAAGNFTNYSKIFFLRSSFSTQINREFLKLDEVISYMGGFCQIFLLIAAILVNFYNDIIYTTELANKLYDFDILNKEELIEIPSHKGKEPENASRRVNKSQTVNMKVKQIQSENIKQSEGRNKNAQQSKDINCINHQNDQGVLQQAAVANLMYKTQSTNFRDNSNNLQFKNGVCSLKSTPRNGQTNRQISLENYGEEEVQIQPPLTTNRLLTNMPDYQKSDKIPTSINNVVKKSFQKPIPKLEILEEAHIEQSNIELTNQFALNKVKGKGDVENQLRKVSNDKGDSETISNHNKSSHTNANTNYFEISPISRANQRENVNKFESPKNNLLFRNSFRFRSNNEIQSEQNLSQNILDNHDHRDLKLKLTNYHSLNGLKKQNSTVEKGGKYDADRFLESELKNIIQRDRSIKISYKYLINKLSCGKLYNTKEIQLLQKANEKVKNDLDIFQILDRIKEIEKFKQMFLTQEQQILFNFFPKPVVRLDEDQQLLSIDTLKKLEKKNSIVNKSLQQQNQKRLSLSFKQLFTVKKAVLKFKNLLNRSNPTKEDHKLSNYQKLFNCYEKLLIESQINPIEQHKNEKLFDLLGREMNSIFKATKLMKDKQGDRNAMNSFTTLKKEDSFSQMFLKKQSSQTSDTHCGNKELTLRVPAKSKFQKEIALNLDSNSPSSNQNVHLNFNQSSTTQENQNEKIAQNPLIIFEDNEEIDLDDIGDIQKTES